MKNKVAFVGPYTEIKYKQEIKDQIIEMSRLSVKIEQKIANTI